MAISIGDFFRKFLLWRKAPPQPLVQPVEVSKYEEMLLMLRKVIMWDDPLLSSLCIIGLNFNFWLLVHWECRLYGVIFTSLLVTFIAQLFYDRCDGTAGTSGDGKYEEPSSQANAIYVTEIKRCLGKVQQASKQAYSKMRKLREEQPGTFCTAACVCFLCLSVIGRTISGLMLLYTLLMLVMTLPGIFSHLRKSEKVQAVLDNFICSSQKEYEVEAEYLPEASGEALEFLKLAGELQLPSKDKDDEEEEHDLLLEQMSARTNDTNESSCSKISLLPEASFMPSHENSLEFLEVDFELPRRLNKSDSEGSDQSDIKFQNKHFNGDSSDDDDDFSKGLEFRKKDLKKPDAQVESEVDAATGLMGKALLTMGANLLSNVVKKATEARTERESSSDTDSFEMISEDDV